jgi:NO-binding membrane sensor protein with MHYT domain
MSPAGDVTMFNGHDPYLVALSIAVAILGGYTGFGLAASIRTTPQASRRLLLAGAAGFLALGIWTMHFVGMLAAPLPADTVYLALPTIVSFLICALVVGLSMFLVSVGEPSALRVTAAALLLGVGIASMHYVGIHGLSGDFHIDHDPLMVVLAVFIGVGTAYGGLRILLARQVGLRLALSAAAFGLAVSGMHYTAMYGMHLRSQHDPAPITAAMTLSSHVLTLVVAVLCFLVAAAFLLFLVPEPLRRTAEASAVAATVTAGATLSAETIEQPPAAPVRAVGRRLKPTPLGGLGQPPLAAPTSRLPIEGANGLHFIDVADIRSIKADAHYTRVHDGTRERMSPWSISEVEAQLDRTLFVRVHRSHIVALRHVASLRKEGDGAVVALNGPTPHEVPVSRAKISQLRAQLGLAKRNPRIG